MIQLNSASLWIADAEGDRVSYDLESLRRALQEAFQQAGIHQEWLAEHLILTLEERVRACNAADTAISEADIEGMLLNVLRATGYGEVAGFFLRRNHPGAVEVELSGALCAWDGGSLLALLRKGLPLSEDQLERLAGDCLQALHKLEFTAVSEAFVRELAVHLWHFRRDVPVVRAAGTADSAGCPPAGIPAAVWVDLAGPESRSLIERGILRPLPSSDIFPAARVEIRLAALGGEFAADGAGLFWCEQLPGYSRAAVQLLEAMRGQISRCWPRITAPSAHLIFPGFHAYFAETLKGKRRPRRQEIIGQVQEAVRAGLPVRPEYELNLSYR